MQYFTLILHLWCIVTNVAYAEDANDNPKINIAFFYEDDTHVRFMDMAESFARDKLKLNIGFVEKIQSLGTEDKGDELVAKLCQKVDDLNADAYKKPDIAIDLTKADVNSEAVKLVVKTINLPTISGSYGQDGDIREWRDIKERQKDYLIQVSPPADVVVQAVRSIVDMQNMTSAVLLFTEEFEMGHKYKSLLQNMPTRHLLTKKANKVEDLRKQIHRLVHLDIVNFFIAGTPEVITEVISEASKFDENADGPYFSDEFAWYSISMTPGKLPLCVYCPINTTLIHLYPEMPDKNTNARFSSLSTEDQNNLQSMFYLDLILDAIVTVAEMKRQKTWAERPILPCAKFDSTKDKTPDELELPLLAKFKEISKDSNNIFPFTFPAHGNYHQDFQLTMDRYSYSKGLSTGFSSVKKIGKWKAGFGDMELLEIEDMDELLSHEALTVFRIVTVVQPPFIYKTEGCDPASEKYSRCYTGYCIDLLKDITDELKFNYTIRDVPEFGYMSDEEPHEWTGVMKEMKDKKADIALGAFSVMAEREGVVDFTVPYYDLVGISILMRKPKASTSLFKFLTVLEDDVWMCILGAYFFTSFLMWLFDRYSPYSYQNNGRKFTDEEEAREFNFKECLWFCMTSLTPQGGGEAPQNLSGRLVAATWWLFGFIIIASYTANLAAFLTVSRLDTPVESMEDLGRQYKVQYAPVNGSSAWVYFKRMALIENRFYEIWKDMTLNSSLDIYEQALISVWDYPMTVKYSKIWQAIQDNNPPATFEEAVERVRNGKEEEDKDGFAFLADATDVRYQTLVNCDLQMVGEEFSRKPYAIAVQHGSPLKDQLNDVILKLLNERKLERLKEYWWNENKLKKDCPRDDGQSDGISIHNIGGVFIVIFAGIMLACLTLVFEYYWTKWKNRTVDVSEGEIQRETLPELKY